MDGWMDGWMYEWMGGSKSSFKNCLKQSKIIPGIEPGIVHSGDNFLKIVPNSCALHSTFTWNICFKLNKLDIYGFFFTSGDKLLHLKKQSNRYA